MQVFVTRVNGFQPLTKVTKSFILNIPAVLYPPPHLPFLDEKSYQSLLLILLWMMLSLITATNVLPVSKIIKKALIKFVLARRDQIKYLISENEYQIKVWKHILQTCKHATPNMKDFVHGVCRQDFTNPLRCNHNEIFMFMRLVYQVETHSPVNKKIVAQRY